MEQLNQLFICASIQRALLSNIVSAVRWIYFKVDGYQVTLTAAFEREPREGEINLLWEAAREAVMDYPNNLKYSIALNCYHETRALYEVEPSGILVYARNEDPIELWENM